MVSRATTGSRNRWTVARGLVAWAVLSAVGVLIVLAPDNGERLVSFGRAHGPSAQDTAGIVVLLIGWTGILVPLVRDRSSIDHLRVLAIASFAGAAVVIWSVLTSTGAWWVLGAAVLVAVQCAAAWSLLRRCSR